jgi:hypothetical protein
VCVVALVGVTGTAPASAHSCAVPVTVKRGAETQIQVGVTVGNVPTSDITFQFQPGLTVTRTVRSHGWTVTKDGQDVHYTGGKLDAQICTTFPVYVRASAEGSYRVRAFQKADDGTTAEHPPDGDLFLQPDGSSVLVNHEGPPNPAFEQVVYATASGAGSGSGATVLILVAATAVVIVGDLVLVARRRKKRRDAAAAAAEVSE